MDNDQSDYASQLRDVLLTADVMSIFFFRVGQSLILDFREDVLSPPLIQIEPMVESPYDRLMSFEVLRSTLPIPEELTLAPWTTRVRAFEEEGVLETMLQRCEEVGGVELRSSAENSFRTLLRMEQQALRDMIRGVGMRTLWRRDEDPFEEEGRSG